MRLKHANKYGPFSRAMGALAAKPVRAVGNIASDLLFGKKLPSHVAKGSSGLGARMRESGFRSISPEKAYKLRADPNKAKDVLQVPDPTGRAGKVFVQKTYRPGGLAGVMMKHPLATGAVGALTAAAVMSRKKQDPSNVVNVYNNDAAYRNNEQYL